MAKSVLKEYHIATNDRLEPKVTTDKKALGVLIVRLILLEPGTDPIRPEMGLGIVSKYRYTNEDNIATLRKDLEKQLATYLMPFVGNIAVTLSMIDKEIHFRIVIDDIIYNFITEEQEDNKVTIKQLLNTTV